MRRDCTLDDEKRELLDAALARQRRATTSTSDGFMFRGTLYAQPGAMQKLLKNDFDGFCSLAGSDFREITPLRGGQPLTGLALKQSISSYKATWRKAGESGRQSADIEWPGQ